MRLTLERAHRIGQHWQLSVRHRSWWDRLRGRPGVIHDYEGRGTVWHRLPSYRRAGTITEGILADFAAWAEAQERKVDAGAPRA